MRYIVLSFCISIHGQKLLTINIEIWTDKELIIFPDILSAVFHFCGIKRFLFCAKNLKMEQENFRSISVASAYYETSLFKEKYSRRKIRRTSWHFRCIYEDLLWQNGLEIQREGAQSSNVELMLSQWYFYYVNPTV